MSEIDEAYLKTIEDAIKRAQSDGSAAQCGLWIGRANQLLGEVRKLRETLGHVADEMVVNRTTTELRLFEPITRYIYSRHGSIEE